MKHVRLKKIIAMLAVWFAFFSPISASGERSVGLPDSILKQTAAKAVQ